MRDTHEKLAEEIRKTRENVLSRFGSERWAPAAMSGFLDTYLAGLADRVEALGGEQAAAAALDAAYAADEEARNRVDRPGTDM